MSNIKDSIFLKNLRGEPCDRTPIWVMRQAGRYLPEYMAVRKKLSFNELCRTPEAACEVTLQPIRRFGFDAAILFSDILVPLEPMGAPFQFGDGGLTPGTYTFGSLSIEIFPSNEGLVITILDTDTGEQTQVIIPE